MGEIDIPLRHIIDGQQGGRDAFGDKHSEGWKADCRNGGEDGHQTSPASWKALYTLFAGLSAF
jgi:hypothetical protein